MFVLERESERDERPPIMELKAILPKEPEDRLEVSGGLSCDCTEFPRSRALRISWDASLSSSCRAESERVSKAGEGGVDPGDPWREVLGGSDGGVATALEGDARGMWSSLLASLSPSIDPDLDWYFANQRRLRWSGGQAIARERR